MDLTTSMTNRKLKQRSLSCKSQQLSPKILRKLLSANPSKTPLKRTKKSNLWKRQVQLLLLRKRTNEVNNNSLTSMRNVRQFQKNKSSNSKRFLHHLKGIKSLWSCLLVCLEWVKRTLQRKLCARRSRRFVQARVRTWSWSKMTSYANIALNNGVAKIKRSP